MSGQLDSKARATAERLLNKFGKPSVYVEITEGAYDPDLGGNTVTETNHDINCFIDEAKAGSLRASGLVGATDLVVMIADKGLDLIVDNTDKLIIDGKRLTIIRDMPEYSGEKIALHFIVCKSS